VVFAIASLRDPSVALSFAAAFPAHGGMR
jgi:hypothetical protein